MPFGWRSRKPGYQNRARRAAAATKIQRAYRARKVAASRAISVSSGPGRNGFRRKVGGKYRRMNKFQRAVRNVVFQTVEKKYRSATINVASGTDLSFTPVSWYHNTLPVIHLWHLPLGTNSAGTRLFPTQGMTDGNRIGDEIYVTGIRMKLMLNLPSDRRTTNVKAWYVPWNTVQGSPETKTNFMHGLANNVMIDQVQTDRWPGLKYLGMFRNSDPDNTTTSAHGQIYVDVWIPIKRKVTFITDGDTVTARGLKESGTIVFAPYDKIGTLETDILINNIQGEATMYYKDP